MVNNTSERPTESLFLVTENPLSVDEVMSQVIDHRAGAVNLFVGTVREITGDKKTLFLQYEAYVPMAQKMLQTIAAEIKEQWPEAQTAIHHRIGKLEICDLAVVIAVSSPHRNESYEASRYAIERIKQIVPIWKKEVWDNGEEWIGNQTETIPYASGKPEGAE